MKSHYLKLNQLRFVDVLKRRGKLGLAAEDMNISQPTASRTLAEIEALVGQRICERHAHGLTFNDFGNVLAARASRIAAEMDKLSRDVDEVADGRRGRVRIGAVTAPAIAYVLPASLALRKAAPHIQLQIDVEPSSMLMQRMREGIYDFVLARLTADDDPSQYDVRRIKDEALDFVVRRDHPLADEANIGLDRLSDLDWMLQPAGSPIWSAVGEAFISAGASFPERITYSSSVLLTIATVSRTDSVAPFAREVAQLLMARDIDARLTTLHTSTAAVVPAFNVILAKNVLLSPMAKRFLDLITVEIAGAR